METVPPSPTFHRFSFCPRHPEPPLAIGMPDTGTNSLNAWAVHDDRLEPRRSGRQPEQYTPHWLQICLRTDSYVLPPGMDIPKAAFQTVALE